jgi:NADP-dependent 3-hydroxy acid dehydrogenase YdfG
MLMARSHSELEETACEVRARGQRVQSAVCDVTDSRQVGEAVDFLEQVDILVNNAGTNVPEPFLEVSEDNLDRLPLGAWLSVAKAAPSSTSRLRWGT